MPVEVRLGGVRDVPGAGFLRVVPDGEQRRPAWFGTLDRSDERSKLRNPQTVLGNRFGIPYSRMPPARAAYPLSTPSSNAKFATATACSSGPSTVVTLPTDVPGGSRRRCPTTHVGPAR